MFRSLAALIGDVLIVVLFVSAGLIQHGTPLSPEQLFLVAWPFVAGLLLGHLAIRAWKAPFSLWPHGVFVWAITVVAAMALRTLLSQGTETSFVIVTSVVTAVGMLGWRALAMYLTRGERSKVSAATPTEAKASTLQEAADAPETSAPRTEADAPRAEAESRTPGTGTPGTGAPGPDDSRPAT